MSAQSSPEAPTRKRLRKTWKSCHVKLVGAPERMGHFWASIAALSGMVQRGNTVARSSKTLIRVVALCFLGVPNLERANFLEGVCVPDPPHKKKGKLQKCRTRCFEEHQN